MICRKKAAAWGFSLFAHGLALIFSYQWTLQANDLSDEGLLELEWVGPSNAVVRGSSSRDSLKAGQSKTSSPSAQKTVPLPTKTAAVKDQPLPASWLPGEQEVANRFLPKPEPTQAQGAMDNPSQTKIRADLDPATQTVMKSKPADSPSPTEPSALTQPDRLSSALDLLDQGKGVAGQGLNSPHSLYLSGLRSWIERHKVYPAKALRFGLSGKVVVQLTVNEEGEFVEIELLQSSQQPLLDDAAIQLLRDLRKYRSPYPDLGLRRVSLRVPIHYLL